MSIRIPLAVVESPDAELIDYGIIPYRILCAIEFEYKDKSTDHPPKMAIIDTGAPLSVIPKYIWKSSIHKILGPSYIAGIVKGEIYRIRSKVGIITVILSDTAGQGTVKCYVDRYTLILKYVSTTELSIRTKT